MFFGPGGRRDFRDTLKRRVCESWEDAGGVVAHRDFESAAAVNDGGDWCDARPGLFAADMDPVGSAQGDGTHRILSEIGAQFQFWMVKEACKSRPDRKRVAARLAGGALG